MACCAAASLPHSDTGDPAQVNVYWAVITEPDCDSVCQSTLSVKLVQTHRPSHIMSTEYQARHFECLSLTFSTHEVGVEGVPGLPRWQDWVVIAEMIVGDQSVFGVPEDHNHLDWKNEK